MELESHNNQKPHAIVLPYPSQGHINPLLQFAKRLISKGIKATLATTHYTVGSIQLTEDTINVEPISDGFDQGGYSQAGNEDAYLSSFKNIGSKTLSQLIEKYRDTEAPVTCIIYDSFLPWALEVAKRHDILGASFFTNSAAVCAIFGYIHEGVLSLPVDLRDGGDELALPGLPPLKGCDVPGFIRAPHVYPAYLAMKMSQFSNLDKADFVFGNTFEALEGQEARSVARTWPAKLIGPMVPSSYLDGRIKQDKTYGASLWKPLSDQCTQFLKSKPRRSVIYVSFGSMVSLSSKQFQEIAHALTIMAENHSYYSFLWVVRESERAKLPEGFLESCPEEKGLIVSWCNQLEMLSHEATGCFVTHCGWNSTLEGLCLGVPMVAMPQWSDQMTDAKFIEDVWRVGVRAKEDEHGIVRSEELLCCLSEVMEGERSFEMRENSRKWRELAKEAVSDGGSSDLCVDEFVNELKSIGDKFKNLNL